MYKRIVFISLLLTLSILSTQVGDAHAGALLQASAIIQGTVQSITLDNDASTGITTVIVGIRKGHEIQLVRFSQETAIRLGFVVLDGDGKPGINQVMLGKHAKFESLDIIPLHEQKRHPVGDALATFFTGIEGLNYDVIMEIHESGTGFGVIAQVLWLTQEIPDANIDDFQILLDARKNNTYTGLPFVNDSGITVTPSSWSELRKAILAGKAVGNLGAVMSDRAANTAEEHQEPRSIDKDKDKEREKAKERENHRSGNGNNK